MPGGRPTKPLALVKGHRTKAEKEVRQKAENSLISGITFKEWPDVKNNLTAHKEFLRLKKVLKSINKDDALHENIINRYCLLHSECEEFKKLKHQCNDELAELHEARADGDIEFADYMDKKEKIHSRFLALDKKIMDKRKMMLDIEKENIMTIQSALRSIPKKAEDEEAEDPMAKILNRKRG